MKLTIDRIEGNTVVCETEDRKIINLSKELFPDNIKSGDIIKIEDKNVTICENETKERTRDLQDRFNKLLKK